MGRAVLVDNQTTVALRSAHPCMATRELEIPQLAREAPEETILTTTDQGVIQMAKLWVVELWNAQRGRWEPTVGCALTRDDCRQVARDWRTRNPDDDFRIHQYVRHRPRLPNTYEGP